MKDFMKALEKALEIAEQVENLMYEDKIEYDEKVEEVLNMKEHIEISLQILSR